MTRVRNECRDEKKAKNPTERCSIKSRLEEKKKKQRKREGSEMVGVGVVFEETDVGGRRSWERRKAAHTRPAEPRETHTVRHTVESGGVA